MGDEARQRGRRPLQHHRSSAQKSPPQSARARGPPTVGPWIRCYRPQRESPPRPHRRARRPDAVPNERQVARRTPRPSSDAAGCHRPSSTIASRSRSLPSWRRWRRAAADSRRRAPATSARSASSACAAARSPSVASSASRSRSFDPGLDRHDALAWCGNAERERNRYGNAVGESEAFHTGRREDQRVESSCVELAQARVDIAANRREARAPDEPRQLRRATHAARANRGPGSPIDARTASRSCAWRSTGSTIASRGSSRGKRRGNGQTRRAARPTCPSRCAPPHRSRRSAARPRFP